MEKLIPPRRADDPANRANYALAAELRAVEGGHCTRALPDGSLLVKADSQQGHYRVWVDRVEDGLIVFGCTCPSGDFRADLPVPCKHAALAARRLEREGLARWADGGWRPRTRPAVRVPWAA
jgi:hypothetical protein